MKRTRDDDYSAHQFKRSHGQSRVGGNAGGDGIRCGTSTSQRLTTMDALTYLKEVKEMFRDQKEKYDTFLEVMKDFKAQRTDTTGVIERVKELFKGNTDLILGFNTFLPKGYEITLDEIEIPAKKTVEFDEAISFVNKIKRRFQHEERVYKKFLDILNMYRKEHKDISEVYNEVESLFSDHPDLLDEFKRFLPDASATPSTNYASYGRHSFQHHNERGSAPSLRRLHVNRDDDKIIMKAHKEQKKRADKEIRDNRNHDQDNKESENENIRDFNLHHLPEKRKSGKKAEEDFGLYYSNISSSRDDKDNLKSVYSQGFMFCEKVKEKLRSSEDYQAFLKCLHIYSNGIIKRNDFQNLVTDLLGKYRDLLDEFNYFFECCENIDGFLAGVMSKKSLGNDGHLSRLLRVEDKDKEQRRAMEGAKEKERYKEKYMGKSIQELDLSACQRCTPSYRLLPEDYPIPSASQRSEVGAQVLNDHWVSVTSGSEDYSFKHMRRNQYEESLFKCEDDRFELDMLLESVSSTAKRVEELLISINENKIKLEIPLDVEAYFTALHIRCIERLYGDHGLDAMDVLRKNPKVALSILSNRLKQKQEEWTRCRSDFNKVWAEIYLKNHYKSLDHRSFYFKQQDSKDLSTKSLVTEIKELKEKMQKDDDVLLATYAGKGQPIVPHLEFEYSDINTHEDLHKLVLYSSQQICQTKEQLNRVMRLWTTFLEPFLGVPPRPFVTGDAEDGKSIQAAINSIASTAGDGPGADGKPTYTCNPDANTSADVTNSCQVILGNGDSSAKEGQIVASSNASLGVGAESNNDRVDLELISGCDENLSRPNDISCQDSDIKANVGVIPSTEGVDIAKPALSANGAFTDETVGPSNIEKEEGELSPVGDLEEFKDTVLGDSIGPALPLVVKEDLCSQDAGGEDDLDADDEESLSVSEAAEDISGCMSAGDECSREEHGVEEGVERDEAHITAESEGEAEMMDDAHFLGEDGVPSPLSEKFLFSVKPLAKYVPAALLECERRDSCIFYGSENFYVLFRLHQALYERILSAQTNSIGSEMKWKTNKDDSRPDPYVRFMSVLYNLLDGSADNAKFEDECRAIIGNQSYVLFTLDKLIYKLIKQLQTVAADEMDNKLLQLYLYEKSRKPDKLIDSVYCGNACALLHEENIYRLECSSSRLSIQLMDSSSEKHEVFAVSMQPNFSAYLLSEFLQFHEKKEPHGIVLERNKHKFAGLDELSATCMAMKDVKAFSGLECKLACSSSKISYVLDTEDFFYRKRKRRNLSRFKSSFNEKRIERFNRLLSSSS